MTASEAPHAPDPESRLSRGDHESLRLWLRLLTCTLMIERRIRGHLRASFATTLPRFDLMAQLERHPQGLPMGELSRRMMVTGGNVTGITDQLVAEGLVERRPVPQDRRVHSVRLTTRGKREFDAMAQAHERWVESMLTALEPAERRRLYALLARLKTGLRERETAPTPGDATRNDASAQPGARRRVRALREENIR